MLWRWRILAVVLALAAARIVYGWPPRPVWTVALHEPTRWELASKPLGFWAGDTVFATGIHAPDRDTFRLSHWSVATGDCLETREIKPEPALGAPLWLSRVSPCGRFLALSGFDRPVTTRRTSVWLIDLNTGETLCHHPINDPCVNQAAFLAFSRDGEWLAFVESWDPGFAWCRHQGLKPFGDSRYRVGSCRSVLALTASSSQYTHGRDRVSAS
jgi:hypothetical protein